MKRIIKFRGFSEIEKRWIYGDLSQGSNGIISISHRIVVPDSIGQFTGLSDKNGVKIFEGDIVWVNDTIKIAEIVFKRGQFFAENSFVFTSVFGQKNIRVIGNTFQNPELLS